MFRRQLFKARFARRAADSPWGKLRPVDWAVITFLDVLNDEMRLAHLQGERIALLGLRGDFKQIIRKRPRAGLRYWIDLSGEEQLAAPIAVWLLGRCCSSLDTRMIGWLVTSDYPASFARHLAKTLRRLEAWQSLEYLASRFPEEPSIQRHAAMSQRPSFHDRLTRFSRHVQRCRTHVGEGASRMPLWFSAEFWRGRRARSAQAIREVLERIHRLVHRV